MSGASTAAAAPGFGSSDFGTTGGSTVRFATYNASLNRPAAGGLLTDLQSGDNAQAKVIAEIVQRNHPDVLLLNEFDYYPDLAAAQAFSNNYLKRSQRGATPIDYPYLYTAPVNTGVPTGVDLNKDGKTDGPDDAYGFGAFPGQYGMLVASKFPIDTANVRTFQNFLWKDMPGNLIPRDYYGAFADKLRLSSKSHWDLPIDVHGRTIHLLASHPTPPSFDGPEDRNGRRNHDEVRLSADYIAGGTRADYIYDDKGVRGGLPRGAKFVMVGDQNSDPNDGGAPGPGVGAINQVLSLPRVQDPKPTSLGAVIDSAGETGHKTPPQYRTADFSDPEPGNLRVDYVLPSRGLQIVGSQVYWQAPGQPLREFMPPTVSSDHRLVWLDLRL
ncbi:endonuclease/exonuclease/phosphatase family protein [Williamsia sp. CHRR-6]|uniref:endonuclease/exonuclease/phosphatase family protein n=1 Tax=Williamsia sp. CHRR-6 TaxID=2835871 RepID=UPI001BD96B7B|nr:endonuclease/exonuclease/phosphatase family protein [Williamsia sp. CHRR-6]MBT0565830.1 endonuclease/exonuclease/phosphatase family protein [Williamsia sp. CHRR-6]